MRIHFDTFTFFPDETPPKKTTREEKMEKKQGRRSEAPGA